MLHRRRPSEKMRKMGQQSSFTKLSMATLHQRRNKELSFKYYKNPMSCMPVVSDDETES